MIIVEGTDKSGKSTFITNLMRAFPDNYRLNLRTSHFGILPDDWDYCDDYLDFISPNVILDRFIDSERAYGPLYRGEVNYKLSRKNMVKVYSKCAKVGAILVYCNPNLEAVQKRIENLTDEMVKSQEQLINLRSAFDSVFTKNYPLEIVTVDTSLPVNLEVYQHIVNRSLVLDKFSKTLKALNYRGFITPYSKRVIYTANVDNLQETICGCSSSPFTDFAIVYSRDITNTPVNLNSLNMEMDIKYPVIVLGEKAMEDYKLANNCLPTLECPDLEFLTEVLR